MIPIESGCDRQVSRSCRDYRHALSLAASAGIYPRIVAGGSGTPPAQAALDNFVRVWARGNFQPSRYSDGSWPVLYTADTAQTTYVEVGYHLQEFHLPSKTPGKDLNIPCLNYELRIVGRMLSYIHLAQDRQKLCETSPVGFSLCQKLAADARSVNIPILEVFSARNTSGYSYPVLEQRASSHPTNVKEFAIRITDAWNSISVVSSTGTQTFHVAR